MSLTIKLTEIKEEKNEVETNTKSKPVSKGSVPKKSGNVDVPIKSETSSGPVELYTSNLNNDPKQQKSDKFKSNFDYDPKLN